MKRIFLSVLILFFSFLNIAAVYKIDAEKNAYLHNNKGINAMKEKNYYAAIKEFEIAIQLNPKTQATAVYYNNLGRTYIIIGYPKMAQSCFENAVKQNPLNLENYILLVNTFKKRGVLDNKLKEYKSNKTTPLNEIMVGIIYVEKGDLKAGITVLDSFCTKEPDLVITPGVRNYIKSKAPKYRPNFD